MSSTLTSIVAANKLSSIKRNYKLVTETNESAEHSPESERKLQEKIEKDTKKREKLKQKREEMHEERNHQREKLRNKIKDKYGLHKDESDDEKPVHKTNRFSFKKKDKKLKEKDFYKYNKAMPDEKNKKVEREVESGTGVTFANISENLAKQADEEEKKSDCIIS